MRKQMKKIGTVLLAAAMAFGLVGCGAKKDSAVVATEAETPSEENEKVIRIGGSGSEDSAMNLELMNVAYKQGYLEDELKKAGYRLDFTFFPGGGPALNEALAAGELDAVVYGDLPAFVGKSNGADTTLIASVNADLQYGIVVANDEIQDPKDLEGKNVIVPEGTAIQYFWENYAAEKGIDTSKVNTINAVEDAASLLMTGDADAIVSTAYGIQSYVYMGVGRILDTGAGIENAHSTYLTAVKTSYLEENPDAAVAINKALIDAYDSVLKDANVLYTSSAGTNLPAEEWEKVYAYDTSFSYLTPEITDSEREYFENFNQWLVDHKLLKEKLDLDSFVDTSYYEKAVKSLDK